MRKLKAVSKVYYKTKLRKLLDKTRLRDLLILVWAANEIRKGDAGQAAKFLSFPKQAIGAKLGQESAIFPWELETLINEAFIQPQARHNSRKLLNTKHWGALAMLLNLIKEIENAESLDDVLPDGILDSMPRLSWRQFPWQRGFKTADKFYRSWYLYCFPEANEIFRTKFGITVERFSYIGFAYASQFTEHPAVRLNLQVDSVGITEFERDAFLSLVSQSERKVRETARVLRATPGQIAYKPSVLRRNPMVLINSNGLEEAYCPMPELLYLRLTDGIFFDLVGSDNLRRLIGERFEAYCKTILEHYFLPKFAIYSEEIYGKRARTRATPDFRIVSSKGELLAIIECKSRRIPFRVLSSPNPFDEREESYNDIVKGVIQVWKYLADLRNKCADAEWVVSGEVVGVVLMLEPWLQMYGQRIRNLIDAATEICAKDYPDVKDVDRINIAFVGTDDWEYSIRQTDAQGFLSALRLHSQSDKFGYLLHSSAEEIASDRPSNVEPFDYHGRIGDVVKWWIDLGEGRIPV